MGAGPTFNGLLFSEFVSQCAGKPNYSGWIYTHKPLIEIQFFLLHCCVYECLHGESCQFKILQKKKKVRHFFQIYVFFSVRISSYQRSKQKPVHRSILIYWLLGFFWCIQEFIKGWKFICSSPRSYKHEISMIQ